MIFWLTLAVGCAYGVTDIARKLRVEFEGAIYHVTIRGVERRWIFRDDADRARFVKR